MSSTAVVSFHPLPVGPRGPLTSFGWKPPFDPYADVITVARSLRWYMEIEPVLQGCGEHNDASVGSCEYFTNITYSKDQKTRPSMAFQQQP